MLLHTQPVIYFILLESITTSKIGCYNNEWFSLPCNLLQSDVQVSQQPYNLTPVLRSLFACTFQNQVINNHYWSSSHLGGSILTVIRCHQI